MTSATEELRRLLDERGIEWKDGDASYEIKWSTPDGRHCSAMYWKPTFTVFISGCTPEQAIAATLGDEPKSMRVFDSMETALAIAEKEVEIEQLKRENAELCDENEELTHRRAELEAAMLGGGTSSSEAANPQVRCTDSKRNALVRDSEDTHTLLPCPFCGGDAKLYSIGTGSPHYGHYHQAVCQGCLTASGAYWSGEQSAIDAWNTRTELENGVKRTRTEYTALTADDVRDLIELHSDASGGNGRDFHNGAYKAIADELNATLGSGTCHMGFIDEYESASGEEEYLCECSECGSQEWEPAHDLPLYCRKCGRKVVDE